jgi:hypothetical protein
MPSQQFGPAAGIILITLAAPGVPNGMPAVTTSKSSGELTSPLRRAARAAFLSTISKSLDVLSTAAASLK